MILLVCTECSIPSAVPIIDSTPPKCVEINVNPKQLEETNKLYINTKNPCFYDALNPHHNNSPLNKYIQDYGCSCDYHNGFVEATVEGYNSSRRDANGNQVSPNTKEVSHACIKIGKLTGDQYHRTDIAFYTFKNLRKPIQVHTFTELESPFDTIFKNNEELLVNQPAISLCDKNDWLNRNIRPSDREIIRRLDYPNNSWPIVNKHIGRNIYKRRLETHPVPAYKLAAGRGFETKHWYEITNNRWLSNAIWGHPIVYPYYLQTDNIWKGKVTLNPLGVIEKQYYGITLKTKPGEIVRLDTRGYKQENKNNKKTSHITTLPPNHKTEMMNASQLISHPFYFYSTYNF